ncbi:phage holin family protein [Escherichia coli]|uniref:phage holin family protein n=1 Tax=Escherichia coli TaxID=562 RepID=UPI003EBB8FDF
MILRTSPRIARQLAQKKTRSYSRRDSRHKPLMSWLAWLLMLLYAFAPLSYLCGRPLATGWLEVFFNLLFCVLVIRARGNVTKIFHY